MNKRKEKVPNKLREYRLRFNYTQEQAAELLKLKCKDHISHWEKGIALPSIENLFRLAKIYNVHPHEIYTDL